ncbi:nucleotide sugar dehydrogenase, partial [Flavobacteriaceae bacterium]|nr:nucleotide sugar dehydrogenase [Flavobacteriaceae bacterium]
FSLMGIDTNEVLEAAATKWNFLPFQPGLVGGHCIGVDPYYLAQKAQEYGYHSEIILAGRRLNDGMGAYVAKEFVKVLIQQKIELHTAKVLVLGITFKENCPDVRNTKVIDVIKELKEYGFEIDVYDPIANSEDLLRAYGITLSKTIENKKYNGVLFAVPHTELLALDVENYLTENGVIYDVKRKCKSTKVKGGL